VNIVYTSGTFDLFHIGHLNILRKSKALGDFLIVGVSTDELVASYKKSEPVINYEDRAEIIRHIDVVNQVVKQETLFDYRLMLNLGVSEMTIGSDWREKRNDNLQHIVENTNIEVVFLPYTRDVSSTHIKESIQSDWQEDA
jgi:glycerol-3-phosphate cytidylyltransferase